MLFPPIRAAACVVAIAIGASTFSCSEVESTRPTEARERPAADPPAEVLGQSTVRKTRLAVVGDFGTGTPAEYRVSRAIKRWTNDFRVVGLVTTGDNIYPSGHPDSFETAWDQPYGWVDRSGLAKVASLGNHDHVTDAGRPVMDLLDMPARRYKRHFRHVDVFVLDSNRTGSRRQRGWLRQGLDDSTARWQIVVFHHPPYSCGEHESGHLQRQAFGRILRRKGADLVLGGHEHSYQRFKKRRGVTYVVTGGGGASLYGLEPCPTGFPRRVAKNDRKHHYVRLVVTPATLRLRAISPGNRTLDQHLINR